MPRVKTPARVHGVVATRMPPHRRFLLLLAIVLALGPALPSHAQEDTGDDLGLLERGRILQSAAVRLDADGPRTTVDKVPLLEMYTATWCAPCGPADRAVERLLDEQGGAVAEISSDGNGTDGNGTDGNGMEANPTARAELHVLAYHPWPDIAGDDPFGVPEGNDRMRTKYDATWFPTTVVDGVFVDRPQTRSTDVSEGMEGVFYRSYQRLAEDARAQPSPGTLEVESVLEGSNATIKVRFTPTTTVPGPLVLTGALWEDPIPYAAANGVDTLRMTVRTMLPKATDADGRTTDVPWTVTWSVPLPEGADPSTHGVTVFVETGWAAGPEDATLGTLLLFTGGIAVATATVAALILAKGRPGRRTPAAPETKDAVPEASEAPSSRHDPEEA